MEKDRVVWLARDDHPNCPEYALFNTEEDAISFADGDYDGDIIYSFCIHEFELVTGVELSPGEYCPIQINIKNML